MTQDTDKTIRDVLNNYRNIAVVGVSDDPSRASYHVAEHLIHHGYAVVPINPKLDQIFGLQAYPDLISAPGPIEIVDVFRRVEAIPGIVDQAIQIGAKAIWMQLGLVEEASAEQARRAGLQVVMDRCIMVEHQKNRGQ